MPPLTASKKSLWASFLNPFAVFGLSMLGANQLLIPFLTANSSGFNKTAKPSVSYLRYVTLAIDGMDRSGCTNTIHAEVQYDPTKTNPKALIEILSSMQYKARLVKEE